MAIISDDGRVLLDDDPRNYLEFFGTKSVSIVDVVGPYEADSYITTFDLLRMRDERLRLGEDVAKEDRANFPIPLRNLTANWCIDVFPREHDTEEDIQAQWDAAYEHIMQQAAAELAVRRQLREKRIGIRRD